MVTAETAVVLPVLVLLTLVAVAAVVVAQAQVRCADAAREAARAVARGEPNRAGGLAAAAAGRVVAVQISTGSATSTATVSMRVQPVGWLPGLNLVESASVATEPDG